ncbi:MAG: FliM/FliN family flagellar motor switch protein [Candidatus Krumholzibacteriia bacterium]
MTTDTRASTGSAGTDLLDDLDLDSALEDAADLSLDLDAVMNADPEVETGEGGARAYDFNRPHSISRRFEHNLRSIAEQFARNATVSLTSLLRSNVVLEFEAIQLRSFAEMRETMPRPACLAATTMRPLNGQQLVQLDMNLCFVILKKLMGGRPESEDRVRPFTEIERGIFSHFVGRLLEILKGAMAKLLDVHPELVTLENNPDYIGAIPGGETLAELKFRVRLEAVEGGVQLAFPLNAFTPVRDLFDPEENVEVRSHDEVRKDRDQILGMIQSTTSELVVQMGELSLTLDRVLTLQEGDLLHLPQSVDSPLKVLIEGREVFLAEAGRVKQNRAVKLVRKLEKE